MKKVLLAGLAVGAFVVGVAGMANALTITNDHNNFLMSNSANSTYTHSFDITATPYFFQPGTPGNAGVDTLTSAQLEIWAYDDNDNPSEKYKLTIDLGADIENQSVISNISGKISDIQVISYLQPDGLLNMKITQQSGDFYLDKEILNFEFTKYTAPSSPVPEPATMLLFGTGIAGLAGIARRKRS